MRKLLKKYYDLCCRMFNFSLGMVEYYSEDVDNYKIDKVKYCMWECVSKVLRKLW